MVASRFSTRFFLLLTALITTAALALVFGPPAHAHSELIGSTPADGDYTEDPVTEVVLEFNEDIQPLGTEVAVTDPSGASVNDGEVVVDGPIVKQPITTGDIGTYTVTWRAVSADGHPISGEYTFDIGEPLPADDPEPAEDTDPTEEATDETAEEPPSDTADAADEETSPSVENINSPAGLSTGAIVAIVVVALAAVGLVVWLLRRRKQER